MITSIKFRGEEVDVEYTDHGYEPDTNAHEIDWDFVDPIEGDITAEEEVDVMLQLYEIVADGGPYFEDDVI